MAIPSAKDGGPWGVIVKLLTPHAVIGAASSHFSGILWQNYVNGGQIHYWSNASVLSEGTGFLWMTNRRRCHLCHLCRPCHHDMERGEGGIKKCAAARAVTWVSSKAHLMDINVLFPTLTFVVSLCRRHAGWLCSYLQPTRMMRLICPSPKSVRDHANN